MIRAWLAHKWQREPQPTLAQDYQVTFSTPQGQRVLQHLFDHVYCTIYEGQDALAMAAHNGRRAVIHEILENLDLAESPEKYRVRIEKERA